MGFGLLLIGLVLTTPISVGFYYTVPIGCIFFYLACLKLARVNKPFKLAGILDVPLFLISLLAVLARVFSFWENLLSYMEGATILVYGVLLFFLLRGISWVSQEVGQQDLHASAIRNTIFSSLYALCAFVLTVIPFNTQEEQTQIFLSAVSKITVFFGIVMMFLNAFLSYKCYVLICMPEDLHKTSKSFFHHHQD